MKRLFRVDSKCNRVICDICSKLTMQAKKTNLGRVLIASVLLTLNQLHLFFSVFIVDFDIFSSGW